jgi:septum site-determining protein MinD
MARTIAIQSYRGGAGKSNLAANLAVALADMKKRVAVLDADVASPGVHVIFGVEKERIAQGLGDVLQGRCDLEDAAYDVSDSAGLPAASLFLVPSVLKPEALLRRVGDAFDGDALHKSLERFATALTLDFLILDTHPGLNRETLLTTIVADALLVLVRPDRQDFHGTAVLNEIASRLKARAPWIVANKVPARIDAEALASNMRATFEREVVAVLPLSEELMLLGSAGLFLREKPDHAYAVAVREVAKKLVSDFGAGARSGLAPGAKP